MRLVWVVIPLVLALIFTVSSIPVSFGSFTGSPNFQLESGIAPDNIQCKSNYVLLLRDSASPICVTEETSDKLLLRDTDVQYIKHDQVIDVQSLTPVLLYSSKLNDDSTGGSSAPEVTILYDQEVTLSKIPKLGETATLSITLTLKPEFSQLSGNSPTEKITLENGFSFVNTDVSSLTLSPTTNRMSYSESLPVVMNIPTVFQAEITPTQVGNWTVYVDGGNYKQRHSFYFIVTEDETILGEKPTKHASTIIPGWIKDNFGWWESGQIKDMKLDNSVQALIKFGILDVNTENIPQEVPSQFRQDIRDWHAGLMSDEDFLVILKDWVEN